MRTTPVAVVLLLMVAPLTQADNPEIGFRGPGQFFGPDMHLDGGWAFIVFGAAASSNLHAHTSVAATAIQYQSLIYRAQDPIVLTEKGRYDLGPGEGRTIEPFRLHATPNGVAGLFIKAQNVSLMLNATGSVAHSYPRHDCVSRFLTLAEDATDLFRQGHCSTAHQVLAVAGNFADPMTARVNASGLQEMEFFNFQVGCLGPSRGPCPQGGGVQSRGPPPNPLVKASLETFSYDTLMMRGGAAVIHGEIVGVILGGPTINAFLSGGARLPGVGAETCARLNCEGHEPTLRFTEPVELRGLRMDDGHGLTVSVAAGTGTALLDEDRVLFAPAGRAVATAGIVASLLVAFKVAFALLSRSPARRLLAHPNRRKLVDYIREAPGATFREVVRETAIPSGTARHHLQVLVQAGALVERHHRSTLRYFADDEAAQSWNTTVLRREPALAQLHDWMLANPGVYQKDVVAAAAGWGWSRSTTQHRLSRLVAEGLAFVRLQGRLKCYSARAEAPLPSPARGSVAVPASA